VVESSIGVVERLKDAIPWLVGLCRVSMDELQSH
jgi:hypothetical protein